MVDLVDRSTGDIISSSDQNLMVDYIENGTHRIHSAYVLIEPGSAPSAAKGILYYDTTDDAFYGCTDGITFEAIGGGGGGAFTSTGTVANFTVAGDIATFESTATSGSTLTVTRDLPSGSTDSYVMSIINDNVDDDKPALYIKQDAGQYALEVHSTKNSVHGAASFRDDSIDANGIIVNIATNGDSRRWAIYVRRNLTSTNTGEPVATIFNDNAGDDQPALQVTQDGAGHGIILQIADARAADALHVTDNSGTTITNLVSPEASGNGTNYFYRNLASADTSGAVVKINQENAGDNQTAVYIKNDGTGCGLLVNQTHTGPNAGGLEVMRDSEAERAVLVNLRGSATGSNWFYRNLASGSTAGSVVFIENDNSSDDQPGLGIQQDGTGNFITGSGVKSPRCTNAGVWTDSPSYRRWKVPVWDSNDIRGKFIELLKGMDVDLWRLKKPVEYADDDPERPINIPEQTIRCSPYLDDWHEQTGIGDGRGVNTADLAGFALNVCKELILRIESLEAN